MKCNAGSVRICGRVVGCEWEDLAMTKVMVIDDNEVEYVVESGAAGIRLMEYEGSWVNVEGAVRRKNGQRYLTIKRFQLEDEYDDILDDDDY